jgi:hypothetical protein
MPTPTEHLFAKLIVTHYVRNLTARASPVIDWQDSGGAEELTMLLSTAHARQQIVLRAEDVLQASRTSVWKCAVKRGVESLFEQMPRGETAH